LSIKKGDYTINIYALASGRDINVDFRSRTVNSSNRKGTKAEIVDSSFDYNTSAAYGAGYLSPLTE
jgi:S-adenosylhomocysteine hydrolase